MRIESRSVWVAVRRRVEIQRGTLLGRSRSYVVMPNSCGQNLRSAEGYDDAAQPRMPPNMQATTDADLGTEEDFEYR